MSGTVVRNIHRADAGAIATLERLGVATVHEAQGRSGLMQPYMRPVWRGARIAGSAVTALCHPGDNWMIHVACEVVKQGRHPGRRLLEREHRRRGSASCSPPRSRRAARKGVVLDMGCRDAAEISEMKFPLWSRAISAKGTVKASLGSVNLPVVCAGVSVRPGDVVVADDDGVVVVPRLEAAKVAKAGRGAREEGSRPAAPACRRASSASTSTTCARAWPTRGSSTSTVRWIEGAPRGLPRHPAVQAAVVARVRRRQGPQHRVQARGAGPGVRRRRAGAHDVPARQGPRQALPPAARGGDGALPALDARLQPGARPALAGPSSPGSGSGCAPTR